MKVNKAFRCKAKRLVLLARNKETISCIKDCSNFDIFSDTATLTAKKPRRLFMEEREDTGETVREKTFTYKFYVICTNINSPQTAREQRCVVIEFCCISYSDI